MGRRYGTGCWGLVLALALGATGCGKPAVEPQIASSSGHAGYAEGYPEQVTVVASDFSALQSESDALAEGFAAYPDALKGKEVDYAAVAEMFERAGAVGRSSAYVERAEQVDGAAAFFSAEKEAIDKKVAGSVGYVAKQANCSADVQSAAVISLDKVIKERLEERLREANDAHRMLDRERSALEDKDAETLEGQLDEVARASYISHIALVRHKLALRRMIAEAGTVEATIDASVKSERAYLAEADRKDSDKAAAEQRIEALKKAKANLSSAQQTAKKLDGQIEQRIKKTQERFRGALDKLIEALRSRKPA